MTVLLLSRNVCGVRNFCTDREARSVVRTTFAERKRVRCRFASKPREQLEHAHEKDMHAPLSPSPVPPDPASLSKRRAFSG